MKNNQKDPLWPKGFDEHERAQILRWAFENTPGERLQFVEDSLEFLKKAGIDYHKQKRLLAESS